MTAAEMFCGSNDDSDGTADWNAHAERQRAYDAAVDKDEAEAMRAILTTLSYYPTTNLTGRPTLVKCIIDARRLLGTTVEQD